MSCITPHIEVAKRLTLLYALKVIEWVRVFGSCHVVIVLTYVLGIAEVDKFVLHGSTNEIEVVREVLGIDSLEIDVYLDTRILHCTYIDKGLVEEVRRYRHLIVSEQVLLLAVEIVDRTIYAVVEQREVDTDVPVLALLPPEVGIDIL